MGIDMSDNTKIEWADHTFNPWEGCQKVGPGCDHCYAETRNARFNGSAINWGPGAPRRRTSAANWKKPLAWNRNALAFVDQHRRVQRVFCASLADIFDNAVDPQWRTDLFDLILATPNLDWLLLTKRIGNLPAMLAQLGLEKMPSNAWLGITVVNQEEADRDIPKLLANPATVRFLSVEPLLGPVDLFKVLAHWQADTPNSEKAHIGWGAPLIDWVIVGGESGPKARPMHPDWARRLRDQCAAAGVPFFFKQWGEWGPSELCSLGCKSEALTYDQSASLWRRSDDGGWIGDQSMCRIGKKQAGRFLDGALHTEFPA